jgi:hypothetical protein
MLSTVFISRQQYRFSCSSLSFRQKGAALMMLLTVLVLGSLATLVTSLNVSSGRTEQEMKTAKALAQAKKALIAHAVSAILPTVPSAMTTARPGDLPCPALDNSGIAAVSCGDATGTTGQSLRLGRLPWMTLGLSDLRDGHGEQLWYAVSNNFKENVRTVCTNPDQLGCLNSDSRGTITVRKSSGLIVNNGANPDVFVPSGVVAVIVAPGGPLQREGAASLQDRSAAGVSNPINYLDVGNGEDNAAFIDSSATDGFINGPVLDVNENIIVNDKLISITYQDLLPKLEERVAGEVLKCMKDYALANNSRYPWAADNTVSGSGDYSDVTDNLFGRIPDTPFTRTNTSSSGGMSDLWPASCNIFSLSDWWLNWKKQAFYGLADGYKPINPHIPPVSNVCTLGGACRVVDPPSNAADKQVVVILSGKRLSGVAGGQPRVTTGDIGNSANYLEDANQLGVTFSKGLQTPTFNDVLVYQ